MLVQTIVYFPPLHVLEPTQLVNVSVLGALTLGPDTTQFLELTLLTNNNTFNALEIELGTPQTLAPTLLTNTSSLGLLTLGPEPASPLVEDALFLDDDETVLLINPDDYLRIQE